MISARPLAKEQLTYSDSSHHSGWGIQREFNEYRCSLSPHLRHGLESSSRDTLVLGQDPLLKWDVQV